MGANDYTSIFDIWINYHLNETMDHTVTTERLLYSVPLDDPERALKDPVVKCEMGKAGSFEFSIAPNHPYYNLFQQMKTVMRVEYDGMCIFRGRVLTIDTNKMNGIRKIHLEGDLAFLNDSYQEGVDDGDRPKTTIYEYLTNVIKQHNEQMDVSGNAYKKFELGVVPGCPNYNSLTKPPQRISIENAEFGDSTWKKSLEVLSALTQEYGGYFTTRYENGTCYLDWLESYFTPDVATQPIKVTKNLIDLNASSEVENIFTYLIPIGKGSKSKHVYLDGYKEDVHGANRYITVPVVASWLRSQGRGSELNKGFHKESDYDEAVTKYGVIYRTQNFDDADTQEKLWNKAVNWIRDNYVGGITSFTATALDLHHIDPLNEDKWTVGTQIPIIYPDMSNHEDGSTPTERTTVTLLSAQYSLHNPEKNSYTLGIPNSLLSKSYRTKSKKTKNDAATSNEFKTKQGDDEDDVQDLTNAAKAFVISKKYNIQEYNELAQESPGKAEKAISLSVIHVKQIFEDKQSEGMTLEKITHDKTDKDVNSVYRDSNGKEWRIASVYNRKLKIVPRESGSKLPSSGTLTWVSGGVNHSVITYGKATSDVVIDVAKTLSMKVDGNAGKITMGTPIDESNILTDEDAAKINKIKNQIVLDAAEGSVEFKDVLDQLHPINPGQPPSPKTRLEMGAKKGKESGEIQVYGKDKTADDNAPPTVGVFGDLGQTAAKIFSAGKDGSGETTTVNIDGVNAAMDLLDPTKAGSTDVNDVLVGLTGGSGGEIAVGKKTDSQHPETKKWMITMNKNLKWKDKSGTEHTVPAGTVGAEDYYLDDIPSFHTEFAYINTLLADYIETKDLVVENSGFIRDLTGDQAKIDKITANKMMASQWMSASEMRASSYRLYKNTSGDQEDIAYLQNCLSECLITVGKDENKGKILFDFYTIGGSKLPTKNFNIADTAFYQEAVSAAKDEGAAAVTINAIIADPPSGTTPKRTLNPGKWARAAGYYTDKDGHTQITESEVWVKANEDANLIPANIVKGVTIFGVEGSYELRLQTRGPISPGTTDKEITPTSGYSGLSKVTIAGDADLVSENIVKGVTIFGVEGSYELRLQTRGPISPGTTDKEITPTSGYSGLSKVTIAGDADLVSENIIKGVSIFGIDGSYEPRLQTRGPISPGTTDKEITPTSNYDGLSKVTIAGDADLVSENIVKGVTIFGVEGSYELRLQTRGPISPGTTDKEITPTSGYSGLSKVTIAGDADLVSANIVKGVTIFGVEGSYELNVQEKGPITPGRSNKVITPDSGYTGLSKVTIAGDDDLRPGYIKNGTTIFGVTGSYKGNIRRAPQYYVPTTSNQLLYPGNDSSGTAYDGWDTMAIKGDSNLVPANIVKGKTIFNVAGTYEVKLQSRGPIAPGTEDKIITPNSGYGGLSKVTIAGDADLAAGNIKDGVSIFGVTGTYKGSGGSASDINVSAPPTVQVSRPSSGVDLTSWRSPLKDAIDNRKYFLFDAWLTSNSSDKKHYYVNFDN